MSKSEPATTESRLPLASRVAAPGDAHAPSLLVMSDTGTFSCPLPARGELTVGRSSQCEVHIDDPKLSRRHLTLRTTAAGVEVVDLGSMNGTLLGERRLEPHTPAPVNGGEMITLGSTVLVVQARPAPSAWHLASHADLRARLAAECARAESASGFGDAFALVKVHFQSARDADAIEEVLGDSLRKKDLVAAAGPGVYEVLLPETSDVIADVMASRVASLLKERGVDAMMHVAVYPRDGDTADLLAESEGAPPSRRAETVDARGTVFLGNAMRALEPIVDKIAAGTINVLILGETGSGKEVIARTLHARSPRSSRPLLCINCAALSESLLESELFGHEKGAFTGAVGSKEGLLESAEGGSVFLDEVGEMPLALQAKLLRVLEQREVLRVGALKPRAIDVRFIAATNRDLEAECARGRFREDLFYRLNGISLLVPPLRERTDEIEPLSKAFLRAACTAAGRREALRMSAQATALLKRYAWPGNVRELKNVIERAVLLASGDTITLENLPVDKMSPVVAIRTATRSSLAPTAMATMPPPAAMPHFNVDERSTQLDVTRLAASLPPASARPPPDEERERIIQALEQCAGNQTRAAKLLGVSRRTLVSRLSTYELPRPRKRS